MTARLLVGCLLAFGCRPPTAGVEPPDGTVGTADDGGEDDDPPKSDQPRAARCEGGRAWDGHPTGCVYEHDGCCYDSPHALCAAAGCEPAQCRILEVRPAQARCDVATPPA